MARTTKALSGPAKDKFIKGLVAATEGVSGDVAARVTRSLTQGISEVRARREVWDELRNAPVSVEPVQVASAKQEAAVKKPATAPTAPTAPATPAAPVAAQPSVSTTAASTFDPFAFSAVAIFTRKGKPALVDELAKIASAADLKQLATAQHLAVDPALNDAAQIRSALVAATERRIAERKAAAS